MNRLNERMKAALSAILRRISGTKTNLKDAPPNGDASEENALKAQREKSFKAFLRAYRKGHTD